MTPSNTLAILGILGILGARKLSCRFSKSASWLLMAAISILCVQVNTC